MESVTSIPGGIHASITAHNCPALVSAPPNLQPRDCMEYFGFLLPQPSIRESQNPQSSLEISTGSQLSVPQFFPLQSPHGAHQGDFSLGAAQKGSGCFQTFPLCSLKGKGQLGGRTRAPRWCERRERHRAGDTNPSLPASPWHIPQDPSACPATPGTARSWEHKHSAFCCLSVPALHRLQHHHHPQSS